MVQVNLMLAVFNLLPVPPLDGSRIFNLLLPRRLYFSIMRYERYIMAALFLLLWVGVLDGPLSVLFSWALSALNWATGYIEFFLLMVAL